MRTRKPNGLNNVKLQSNVKTITEADINLPKSWLGTG